jgi:hypothetical protein
MLRRIYALNYMDAFIAGIVAIAIPVIMVERGIDIASIGLIFAIAPVLRLAVRLASSAAADRVGERLFYTLNSASNLAQAVCYAIGSTFGFAAGKLFDGARESFILSVNRTSVLSFAPNEKHIGTAQLISGRLIANAGGSLAVFLLMPLGGFDGLLLVIAALSVAMLFISSRIPNTHSGKKTAYSLKELLMLGKGRRFYETATAMMVGSTFYAVMFYIAMPIFLRFNGFSLQEIGFMYAVYLLLFGTLMGAISRREVKIGGLALAGGLIFAASLTGISFAGRETIPFIFIFMSLGDACLAILWERIIYLEAKGSGSMSTDIALLHFPAGIAGIFTIGASGFIIQQFGFGAIFGLTAVSLAAFAAWSAHLSKG